MQSVVSVAEIFEDTDFTDVGLVDLVTTGK